MKKHSIMVVDDSRIVHAEMRKMLEGSEFQIVGSCRSGEEAIERYEELKPELITLDVIMPGMDGIETCRKVKDRWPEAQIFVVSSMAYDEIINKAVEAGAKGFLFKPFTKDTLLEGLRGAFRSIGE